MKKILKAIFTLVLLGLLGGAGYIMYDYTQNPQKYDEFAQMFQDKITGKDKIVIEEVSPFITPEMTLTLENSSYEGESYVFHEEFQPDKPIVMCYGKDMGGNIYIPRNFHVYQSASLYSGPDVPEQDITEYVTQSVEYERMEVSEELLMSLEAGEYYIVMEFMTEEGDLYPSLVPLIVEEETTFNSNHRGFVIYADEYGCINNDLEEPKEISFTFYNLGDNPIRAMLQASEASNGYVTVELEPEDYYINERGDTVVLKTEYLQRLNVNRINRYSVRFANGEVMPLEVDVCTVKGDSLKRLTISAPSTYSLSEGGDFAATYDLKMADFVYSYGLYHYPMDEPGYGLCDEELKGRNIGKYLDMDTKTITFPEEFMKQIPPDNGNTFLFIVYSIDGVLFSTEVKINVTN